MTYATEFRYSPILQLKIISFTRQFGVYAEQKLALLAMFLGMMNSVLDFARRTKI